MDKWKSVHWSVNYGFVDATYESADTLASVVEPDGIQVVIASPGSRSTTSEPA